MADGGRGAVRQESRRGSRRGESSGTEMFFLLSVLFCDRERKNVFLLAAVPAFRFLKWLLAGPN